MIDIKPYEDKLYELQKIIKGETANFAVDIPKFVEKLQKDYIIIKK